MFIVIIIKMSQEKSSSMKSQPNPEIKYSILKNDGKIIEYIYHLADIHIRQQPEYKDEYEHVFGNLYNKLNNVENKDKSIIVICGDLMHNNCIFNTTSIEILYNFLDTLTKIMPVFIITGNHDAIITNSGQNTDALSPLLKKTTNLYYLLESGVFVYNNIAFGVSSLYDGMVIKSNDIIYDTKLK